MLIGEVKKSGNDGSQKFEEFKTDPDLEGTTIKMDDESKQAAPQAISSESTAESNQEKP